jgi:1,4-alpha-glucan branching enzyme
MYAHPGKKLLFMGGEFGQSREWNHDQSLDWHLTQFPEHDGLRRLVQHLNWVYTNEPALYDQDDSYDGFEWIDFHDSDNSVVAFLRKSRTGESMAFIVNATPVVREAYRVGVNGSGWWEELINTDAQTYGGSNIGNFGGQHSEPIPWQGKSHSLLLRLPPLAVVGLKRKAP